MRFSILLLSVIPTSSLAAEILVYGPAQYNESSVLDGAGHTVTVWDSTAWSSASTEDFAAFDSIYVGDKDCSGPYADDLELLFSTMETWGPAITGNILVTAMDAACHYPNRDTGAFMVNTAVWA